MDNLESLAVRAGAKTNGTHKGSVSGSASKGAFWNPFFGSLLKDLESFHFTHLCEIHGFVVITLWCEQKPFLFAAIVSISYGRCSSR